MAEPQTQNNLAQNPSLSLSRSTYAADADSGNDLSESVAVSVSVTASDEASKEDLDSIPQPKRRKHRTISLENLDELTPASVGFSVSINALDDASNEDPDSIRRMKRRKHCPTALENLDELTYASNSSFGFTFDTKFGGFSAEVTPKFGSFNSIVPGIEKKEVDQTQSSIKSVNQTVKEEDDEIEDIVGEALREVIGKLESVAD